MACITHYCFACDTEWENNKARDSCPLCPPGTGEVMSTFDEQGDEHDGTEATDESEGEL